MNFEFGSGFCESRLIYSQIIFIFVTTVAGPKLVSWNVPGLRSILRDSKAMGFINKCMVFCIQETMSQSEVVMSGFKVFCELAKKFSEGRGRPSGGLATGVNVNLKCESEVLDLPNESVLWVALKFERLKFVIGNVYRRPGGNKVDIALFFQLLRDQVTSLESDGFRVIIAGDFNVRVGSSMSPAIFGSHASSLIPASSADTTISSGAEELGFFGRLRSQNSEWLGR